MGLNESQKDMFDVVNNQLSIECEKIKVIFKYHDNLIDRRAMFEFQKYGCKYVLSFQYEAFNSVSAKPMVNYIMGRINSEFSMKNILSVIDSKYK